MVMTNKKIIINDMPHETRVALIEDGNISELFIERQGASDSSGNIYKGRVQRVFARHAGGFVDIGLQQAAFLYVNDIVTNNFDGFEAMYGESDEDEDDETEQEKNRSRLDHRTKKVQPTSSI